MDNILGKLLSNKWLREILLFVFLLAIFTLGDHEEISESWKNFFIIIGFYTLLYVHALIHRFWLFPILFDKKQILKYCVYTVLCLTVFSFVMYQFELNITFYDPKEIEKQVEALRVELSNKNYVSFWGDVSINVVAIIFFSSIYFVIRHFDQDKKQKEIRILVNQLEISQLREQLNPHFMFNTLNNLYGVSLEQPQRMPDLIMQLSQMMRYQIEATKKEYVLLNDEIEFIEGFISIENERVSNRCEVNFEKSILQNDLKIAPILLLPFIENAFKHGTNSAEKSFVHIKAALNEQGIFSLKIENSIPQKKKTAQSTGVGLENVKQRLMRLYADKYELKIESKNQIFSVNLALRLHS